MTPADRLRLLERMSQIDVRRNELLSDMIDVVRAELTGYDVPHDWPSWRAQLAHHLPRLC